MGLEVATIAAIAASVSAAATLASGAMSFMQARSQAKVMEQQANFERAQAQIDADEFRRRQRRLLGTARATRGATGVDLLSGSPLQVDDATIDQIVFETERVRQGGDIRAMRMEQQAGFTRASGASALAGSVLSAGSTFLTSDAGQSMFGGASTPVAASTRAGRADLRQPNAMGRLSGRR